jgi:hypothetical protein
MLPAEKTGPVTSVCVCARERACVLVCVFVCVCVCTDICI